MQENNNIWTVKQMLDNIDKLITSTEMYEEDEMRSYATESRQSGRSNCTNNVTVRNNIPQEILCRFCQQQGHRHAECNIHRTPSERRNSLRNRTICWKCLSVTHTSRQCTRENCSQCGQNHHRLLCLGRAPIAPYPNETLTNTWNQAQHTNEEKQISASQNSSIANNSLNHVNASENNSLRQNILMTADAEIWNHNTNQFERLIILFDSGSHLSFIPESHAKHLKLATSGSTRVTLSGLGGCTESFNSNTAPVRFRTSIGQILNIQLLTKPLISNSFKSATVAKQDLQFLQQLNVTLSNPRISGEIIQPRILIGLDLWVEFIKVTNAIIVMPSGLLLQPTVFGYAIPGSSKMPRINNDKLECIHNLSEDSSTRKELNRIYSLEGLGISDDPTNQEDETFEYMEK
uniref:Peptidase A2 domain-containing protein n=1 Tax=Heterorhabditis bacteriophora TaxID=37862 RepID=A0A1I7WH09_HETBA